MAKHQPILFYEGLKALNGSEIERKEFLLFDLDFTTY
jgi:hypothetical protein